MLQPPHAAAMPVRCRRTTEPHGLHHGADHEPPRTVRNWLDSNSWAIVDGQGSRIHRDKA